MADVSKVTQVIKDIAVETARREAARTSLGTVLSVSDDNKVAYVVLDNDADEFHMEGDEKVYDTVTPVNVFGDAKVYGRCVVLIDDTRYYLLGYLGTDTQAIADSARAAASDAKDAALDAKKAADAASETALATSQHFYADSAGVHVTETAGSDSTGANVLLNSRKLSFMDGDDEIMTVAPTEIDLGNKAGFSRISMCDGLAAIDFASDDGDGNPSRRVYMGINEDDDAKTERIASLTASVGSVESMPHVSCRKDFTGGETDDCIILGGDNILFGTDGTPVNMTEAYNRVNAPYIVSYAKSGSWNVIKYSNGYARCWLRKSYSKVPCTTASGSIYYNKGGNTISLPSGLFTATPAFNFSLSDSAHAKITWVAVGNGGSKTTTPVFWFVCNGSFTFTSVAVSVTCDGSWK